MDLDHIRIALDLWPLPEAERERIRARKPFRVYREWPSQPSVVHYVVWTPSAPGWQYAKLACRCGLGWVGPGDEETIADLIVQHLHWRPT